ncbi:TetR/AcrR family transcriptional regulator [Gordonia crocea]|uniref:TetR family transcriptional regulator n=1 Tax=Gordonia crocea TaxID=589162 RepID=A0A7I9V069_9ACTN|nr:TetR/AcrR family transcriptional regulator [Gordonia crocea]GED98521.1 TetR family transcriptional regulator [Gordonia crocea]
MAQARRNKRGEAQRQELLEAAAQRFAHEPYDQVSLDAIAADAGMSRPSLYYYFGSKRDCYLAVIESWGSQMLITADAAKGLGRDDVVARLLDTYLDFAENSEEAYRTVMGGGLGNDPQVQAFINQWRTRFSELIMHLAGRDAPVTPAIRIQLSGFLGFIEGATLDWLDHRDVPRSDLSALLRDAGKQIMLEHSQA